MQSSLNNLSKDTLVSGHFQNVVTPRHSYSQLPEKVLQFGTGVLLRALPDYYIDKANRKNIFNGRIVVVKSTSQGDTHSFKRQDSLYTHCLRGIENGKTIEENIINSSISRVLDAHTEWKDILACASNININIVISNTTEAGLQYIPEKITDKMPESFPGKLLACLHSRYLSSGKKGNGMIILPTELLPDNGTKLKNIVEELAEYNNYPEDFRNWLVTKNTFCNTLVDRIVPGAPSHIQKEIEQSIGYTDELMIMSETYGLWAIEADDSVRSILTFSQADPGILIEEDITKYRELKLRLLNCNHSMSCALSFLAGMNTVRESMANPDVSAFIMQLMQGEIAVAIQEEIIIDEAIAFSNILLNRFRNPYINHQWLDVSTHYTAKIKIRLLPILEKYYRLYGRPPRLISLGFAAYIFFSKPVKKINNQYYGEYNGVVYPIRDEFAASFDKKWKNNNLEDLVRSVLSDTDLWEEDINLYDGLTKAITKNLESIINEGIQSTLKKLI